MKKIVLVLKFLILVSYCSFSQGVGIGTNTPDPSAALDITGSNRGLLIPRMSTIAMNAIPNPAKGLQIYDTVVNLLMVNVGTPVIPNWQAVAGNSAGGAAWGLNGNNGTNPTNQFIGTSDNQSLRFRVNNIQAGELHPVSGNISWGLRAGQGNVTGVNNIAIGADALKVNANGSNLVAIGDSALFNNDTGNPLPGVLAVSNTAIGSKALFNNTFGSRNTATGSKALFSNTEGNVNAAYGELSLFSNTTGSFNYAIGSRSLFSNTMGNFNTAVGSQTLFSNTTGSSNTAIGQNALQLNSTGDNNVAIGDHALMSTTSSLHNTVVGYHAAFTFDMGSDNTIVGANADANQDGLTNATALGSGAIVDASNKVRIGNGAVTVIEGQVPFTTPSDGRFKFNIKEDVQGLEFIMRLRPVTYQFDVKRFDKQNEKNAGSDFKMASYNAATAIRRTGFIAQEVEKAADATSYDFSGIIKPKTEQDHYSLSYESFVVPLVKAVQEQQQMINELKKQNEDLSKNNNDQKILNENLLKQIEEIQSSLKAVNK
jgi:hypothetical protein